MTDPQLIVTLVCTAIGSGGLGAVAVALINKKDTSDTIIKRVVEDNSRLKTEKAETMEMYKQEKQLKEDCYNAKDRLKDENSTLRIELQKTKNEITLAKVLNDKK